MEQYKTTFVKFTITINLIVFVEQFKHIFLRTANSGQNRSCSQYTQVSGHPSTDKHLIAKVKVKLSNTGTSTVTICRTDSV